MSDNILEVDKIEKSFGRILAVDNLSFAVQRGEIFAFLGPNGAGKSTSVRMLVNILRPDAGRIVWNVDGVGSSRLDPTRLGYLPEDRGLYPEVPVIKTLTFMGVIRGLERSDARAAAQRWLDKLELGDRAEDKLDSLSKGNQQKVQFIGSILHRPTFAVLDEPFSGLDPLYQDMFLEILEELRSEGTTILLSAHNMQLVERVADRVLMLSQGREVVSGTIAEIKAGTTSMGECRVVVGLGREAEGANFADYDQVTDVTVNSAGEYVVELQTAEALSTFLRTAAREHSITSIQSQQPSLHEVFVRRLGRSEATTEGVQS